MYKLPSSQPLYGWIWQLIRFWPVRHAWYQNCWMEDEWCAIWDGCGIQCFYVLISFVINQNNVIQSKHSYWSWEHLSTKKTSCGSKEMCYGYECPEEAGRGVLPETGDMQFVDPLYFFLFQDVRNNHVLPHQGLWCTPEIVGVPDGAVKLLMNSVLIGVKVDMHCIDEMVYIMSLRVVKEKCFDMWYIFITFRFYCHGLWYQHQEMRVAIWPREWTIAMLSEASIWESLVRQSWSWQEACLQRCSIHDKF